ncbi:MAG: hypothetical protein ACE5HN_04720, partial [Nitrospiria bacterium]
ARNILPHEIHPPLRLLSVKADTISLKSRFLVTIQLTDLLLHGGVAAVFESSRITLTLRFCAPRALP